MGALELEGEIVIDGSTYTAQRQAETLANELRTFRKRILMHVSLHYHNVDRVKCIWYDWTTSSIG